MREFSEQELVRREKIEKIREYTNPYPDKFERTHTISEARNLEDGTSNVKIAGRIAFVRKMGKLSFARIRNLEDSIQVQFQIASLGEEKYEFFKKLVETGDFIGVIGDVITTQTGEKTVNANDFKFLGKSLRPLPEKFHGLQDTEQKYRERYVDLIMNQESRDIFLGRSRYYLFVRNFLAENGFLEVETPIIQTAVSGASAKPFFTHYNALDLDCNLRIAPECYLKECIAGGYDRVFEFAKCFRNEGMDPQHNPEFTQIEWYASYWNFEDNITFFKEFLTKSIEFLRGTTKISFQGHEIDFKNDWNRINYVEELKNKLGFEFLDITDVDLYKQKIVETNLFKLSDLEEYKSLGQVTDFLYKKLIRENIINPTILYNYPAYLKPLARVNDNDPRVVDVFQVVICGNEICNAFSELVNPEIQRANFEEQLKNKENGDMEAMDLDEGYLRSMEQGMPPISGLGVGIDRLIMLAFDAPSIRDVILFPTMKPEK